ncbi:MAG: hypothetical protein H7061_13040 [Bdellovibrionaceae bacterium]|nr:hypothetical protein [Bdellovibrio sp.]
MKLSFINLKKTTLHFTIVFLAAATSHALAWKGIFIAGDDSIENFDNGREDVTTQFAKMGQLQSVQLSSSDKFISEQKHVFPATSQYVLAAFDQMSKKAGDACLIHMTSHGTHGQGIYLSKAGILPPKTFEQLLTKACGNLPTVVLISACYSGQFITESIKGPNRIILTAARADRPSFGCSADTRYTYWDECLLEELPVSKKWTDLYQNVSKCISKKETALGAKPSEPQAFFGANTKNWEILK